MKTVLLLCLFVTVNAKTFAQTDSAKSHIRQLLELTGSGKLGIQVMTQMIGSFKTSLNTVPDEFWDKFLKETNANDLVELLVPIYARHYKDEDILQLIEFYKSPLGKKVTEELPAIATESYSAGQEWGKKLGQKVVEELKEKGYL